MATTIVSNLTVFSDATGHGNQSHLIYAANQQRWWLFNINTKTATFVSCYVSSSNDLTTATWSASTNSPDFPNGRAMSTEQRNLGVLSVTNGSTDAVHVSVSLISGGTVNHVRGTLTGASSISWESWVELSGHSAKTPQGNVLGLSTPSEFVHESTNSFAAGLGSPAARISSNADSGGTWTNSWGAVSDLDSVSFFVNAFALAPLALDAMACIYEDGAVADPNSTGLRYIKYVSGTSWPTSGSASVGTGSTTQDANDWCLCRVDGTHTYAFRRSGSNTFDWRVFDGSSWTTPTNGVPNQNHLAGSGLFAATDGASLWLFLLDSASNQPVQYCKASNADGATPTWGTWTQLEPAGITARNYISGNPVVANSQIGVVFTAVNGTNFDVVVVALQILPTPVPHPSAFFSSPSPGVTYPGLLIAA